MKLTNVLARVGQAAPIVLWIALFVFVVGVMTQVATEVLWPRIYCQDLSWDVVVADYKTRQHRARYSGACLMTLVKTVEQAEKAIALASQEYDEETAASARDRRAEIVQQAFAEAKTCDQAKAAWNVTRQNVELTLSQADYAKIALLCNVERLAGEKGGR